MSLLTLTIHDEKSTGQSVHEIKVGFNHEKVTVKEIIEARVRAEVNAFNEKLPEYYHGLVEPSEAEWTLNGYKMKSKKRIDAEKQVYVALDAFQKNGFFVLVDSLQCEELDQPVTLRQDTRISFIKLTPLVGG